MPEVMLAAIASANPMGQQVYERELGQALRSLEGPARVKEIRVASLRSPLEGVRRSPSGFLHAANLPLALVLGALTYRTTDLVHRLDLRLPPHPGKEVVTVHDLPPCRYLDEGKLPKSAAAGARRARVVICPSNFAAGEVKELLGVRRVEVIPYGLSETFSKVSPADDHTLKGLGIDRPFVLHAAGATARKNLAELARAWADVASRNADLLLVLAGPPDPRRNEAFAGVDRVVMTGRLPPHAVASLMARATLVVVPSVYEGFGLPALEAMACGAPVVAARAGALPEVCADAALLVEPTGVALAAGILSVISDEPKAHDLRARGRERAGAFSWAVAARAHASVYEEAN
jgi:glycosyltransferase involved in cell wall biosynthesis